jgi:phage/plasmid-associated DNA primase
MVKSETYEHLTQHLSEAMEKEFAATRKPEYRTKTLIGLGRNGKAWSSWVETLLTDLFEQFLCLDKEKRVLVGEDGSTLYAYNGAFFEQIDVKAEKFMAELIKRTMRALKIGSMYVQKCPSDIARSVVSTLTSSDEYLYKPDRRYIAFENGIFDIEKGSLKKFNIKYRPYIALDLEYRDEKECYKVGADEYGVGDNPCKLWETKIKEIIPNNDARDAFQQFCGSLLLNRENVKVEYICYLVGTGSNGKSVVASTIANVFGDKFFSRFSLRQLFKDGDARVNIAALDGKICNLIGDLEAKDVGGGDFKRAISGEWFQGRKNYKDPIMVKFPPLLCATNELPESADDSWGYHRRQLPIYTTTRQWTEEDKDPYLTQKLSVPLARMYVFLWIYAGMKKILRNNGNIILGEDVVKAQKVLQNHANSARAWWADSGYVVIEEPEKKDPRWRPLRDLYQEYCTYATDQGYEKPMKNRDVSGMLKSLGYSKEKGNIRRMPSGDEYCVGKLGYDTTEDGEPICGA